MSKMLVTQWLVHVSFIPVPEVLVTRHVGNLLHIKGRTV